MNLRVVFYSLVLLAFSTSVLAGRKTDFITKLRSHETVPVFVYTAFVDAEGVNGSCKGVQDQMPVDPIYRDKILGDFVENLKLDYKSKAFVLDTTAYTIDSLKSMDSVSIGSSLFVVLDISGTYYTEQDFSSNQGGFYLSFLTMRAHFKVFEIDEENKVTQLRSFSKELCSVSSEKKEHPGCMSSVYDFPRFVDPNSLVGQLQFEISKEQKLLAAKHWSKLR